MSWELVEANSNAEGTPWVSIGVHAKSGGGQVKITMSKTVVNYLGVKEGQKVVMYEGKGDHSGWVEIARAINEHAKKVGYMLSNRKTSKGNLAFRFSARRLNLEAAKTRKITTDDAALVLTEDRGFPTIQLEIPEQMFGGR